MEIRYNILLLIILMLSSCKGQIDEIKRAHKVVAQAKNEIKSEEFQSNQNKIRNSDSTKSVLIKQIDKSDSNELIKSKNQVLEISASLKDILVNSKKLLEAKHGLDEEGNLRNKTEIKHVNLLFLKEHQATKIKELFMNSEIQFMNILSRHQLALSNQELPIKLNLFMEKEGQKWENYFFQDMPAMALLPIINKLNDDVILTELLMLEKLVDKENTSN